MQQAGTDSEVPLSSPRTLAVEDVAVTTPRSGVSPAPADVSISVVESASQHAAALATLNAANAAKMAAFTPTEQDSVHHTLYAGESSGASSSSSAAYGGSSSLFTPSRASRICLSARANDLPSNTWMAEATTLLALFSIDTAASASKYQLVSQTEFVKDTNAPTFKHQFVLDRSDSRARAQTYMLRVYDVESEVIDEAAYLGLITFNLEELLQNCRSTNNGGGGGGGFVSVVLPWIHPTNARWHDQLVRAHSTVTLSLQIPVEAGSPAPPVSQSAHVYTRLVNYLAPNILAQNMDLTVEAVVGGSGGSGSGDVDLVSLWYRPRSTALFQMLGYVALSATNGQSAPHTVFVVSNEQFLAEQADGVSDQGFEVKVLAHQKSRLLGGGALALATARNAERALGASVNTPVTGGNTLASATRGGLVGAASITFQTLLMSLDSESALVLPLENGAATLQMTLKTRRPIPEVNLVDDDDEDAEKKGAAKQQQALSVPSLPASIPPSVLTKAHELLRTGLYFTEYPAPPVAVGAVATSAEAAPVTPLAKRDVLVRMIDGVAEGLGKATRLEWTVAATSAPADASTTSSSDSSSSSSSSTPPSSSMALARIDAIYGGRDSSPAFAAAAAAAAATVGGGGGDLPSSDVLFTIVGAGGQSLSLEAPSWQTRDTFIFSILSYQASCALPVALWHPAGLDSSTTAVGGNGGRIETTPRIVAQEPMTAAVQEKKPQLGGSHGSLARTPAKAANGAAGATTASKTASDAAVDLQEVLAKLEKLFDQGRNFIRFTSGAHRPHYISLFLRKDPVSAADSSTSTATASTGFGLYWCKADHRTVSSTRCLHSSEIVGLALGKQTAVFRKDDAALAPASHCFSIVGVTRSLHLQSWNERDRDTYAFGIASLLKQYGSKPKLWQADQYQAQEAAANADDRLHQENQSEMLEEADGTQQVSPADIPTLANAQGYRCAIELVIKCRNLPVTKSTNNVIVCAFDRDDTTEKLTYLGQTEKQTTKSAHPEFRKVFRLTYDSTILRKLRFNVYDLSATSKQMDDEDRIGSAMMLLKEVVDGAGIEFVYRLTHENPVKQAALQKQGATIIIQCAAKSEMALDIKSTPTSGAGAAAVSSVDGSHNGARADSAQVKAWQHQLYTGDVYTLHYASRDPQSQFVFFTGGRAADPADLGSLNWCDVGTRHESPAASLALRDIVRVVIGNDRLAVTPFSSAIPSAICFTLIGADSHRVDVECRSQNQRDLTVHAIVGILRAGGKQPHVQEIA